MPLVKTYRVTYVDDDDKPSKITCQRCNGYVRCDGKNGELIYITFLHAGMSTLGIYPKELSPEKFFFRWPGRTKMHRIYERIFKEYNGYHNYLRCPYIQDYNFEVLRSDFALGKLYLACVDRFRKTLLEMMQFLFPIQTQFILLVYCWINVVIL